MGFGEELLWSGEWGASVCRGWEKHPHLFRPLELEHQCQGMLSRFQNEVSYL